MEKEVEEKEVYINEFRKKIGNRHFLYMSGEWKQIKLFEEFDTRA
jgi:hypothetical protein